MDCSKCGNRDSKLKYWDITNRRGDWAFFHTESKSAVNRTSFKRTSTKHRLCLCFCHSFYVPLVRRLTARWPLSRWVLTLRTNSIPPARSLWIPSVTEMNPVAQVLALTGMFPLPAFLAHKKEQCISTHPPAPLLRNAYPKSFVIFMIIWSFHEFWGEVSHTEIRVCHRSLAFPFARKMSHFLMLTLLLLLRPSYGASK